MQQAISRIQLTPQAVRLADEKSQPAPSQATSSVFDLRVPGASRDGGVQIHYGITGLGARNSVAASDEVNLVI